MKNILLIGWCVLTVFVANAQLDTKRMDRDLEISKNILSSLFSEEGNRLISSRRIDANYVEGFGVVFKIPSNKFSFNYHFDVREPREMFEEFAPMDGEDMEVHVFSDDEANVRVERRIERDKERAINEELREEMEEQRREMEEQREKMEEQRTIVRAYSSDASSYVVESDLKNQEQAEKTEEILITFLADYADLIGQLKPNDKIRIIQESRREPMVMIWNNEDGESEVRSDGASGMIITAEKKDISAIKSGKIEREEFEKRLDIKKGEKKERIADLEIFGNVFKQYFSPEYSKTFFTDRKPDYERFEDLGVIFKIKTYSSYMENDMYYFPALGKDKVNKDERKGKIEALYPQFITDLKAFMVDYGRTIRSLNDSEKLVLDIQLTKCEVCSIPASIEASIPVSQLKNFDQQKISREKAIGAVNIKEK